MIQRIKSKNNVFQHLMVLKTNRKKRHRAGEFLVEGVRSIKMAVANRWKIRSFVFVEGIGERSFVPVTHLVQMG